MENPPDEQPTEVNPPYSGIMMMPNSPRHGLKEALGFDGDQPEDRWLWFAVRLSMVLFFIGIQVVVIAAFAKVMLSL